MSKYTPLDIEVAKTLAGISSRKPESGGDLVPDGSAFTRCKVSPIYISKMSHFNPLGWSYESRDIKTILYILETMEEKKNNANLLLLKIYVDKFERKFYMFKNMLRHWEKIASKGFETGKWESKYDKFNYHLEIATYRDYLYTMDLYVEQIKDRYHEFYEKYFNFFSLSSHLGEEVKEVDKRKKVHNRTFKK